MSKGELWHERWSLICTNLNHSWKEWPLVMVFGATDQPLVTFRLVHILENLFLTIWSESWICWRVDFLNHIYLYFVSWFKSVVLLFPLGVVLILSNWCFIVIPRSIKPASSSVSNIRTIPVHVSLKLWYTLTIHGHGLERVSTAVELNSLVKHQII